MDSAIWSIEVGQMGDPASCEPGINKNKKQENLLIKSQKKRNCLKGKIIKKKKRKKRKKKLKKRKKK